MAHEFGHLAARDTAAFADWQRQRATDDAGRERLEELFADVFATYALGPAFACDAILVQLSPQNAETPRGAHPAHALRARAILRTLELMNGAARTGAHDEGPYATVLQRLEATWAAAVGACGGADPTVETATVDELIALVDTYYRLGARFAPHRWAWAVEASRALPGRVPGMVELRELAAVDRLEPPPTLADLLNVLWAAHLSDGISLGALSGAANQLAYEYLEGENDD
jgi:hypothetical protein